MRRLKSVWGNDDKACALYAKSFFQDVCHAINNHKKINEEETERGPERGRKMMTSFFNLSYGSLK